jgi:methionyl-tRNA formyltransferase
MLRRARGYEGGGGSRGGGGELLRLVFLGTPRFAVPALERLAARGHTIEAVVTQPDRPRGRGQVPAPGPVKEAAVRMGLDVYQPERIRHDDSVELLRRIAPDAIVVVGYGQIIPQSIIDIPPLGILNLHASLLPAWRGAAPIQWAIASGDTVTGVTIMRIDAGLDTGDILLQWETPIGAEETAPELAARLAEAGSGLLVEALDGLVAGRIRPRPQDHARATRAPVLRKEDGRIDWRWPAARIHCRARGFLPWPGAYTTFRGQTLQLWRCRVADQPVEGVPGSMHPRKRRLLVACAESTALELLEVQLPGKKRIPADAFLSGHRVMENELLGEGAP